MRDASDCVSLLRRRGGNPLKSVMAAKCGKVMTMPGRCKKFGADYWVIRDSLADLGVDGC
jgi:hypothetical protein